MNEQQQLGDLIHIVTADGLELFFSDPDIKLLAYGNLGAPPTEFITRRGYKQNGSTEIDFLLQPRTITVEFWQSGECSRQTYWDNRKAFHDFLRPNRGGALTFTLRTPNGNLRSIIVRADPGMAFAPRNNDNSWQIQEQFDFIAFNPVFFNAEQTVDALSVAVQTQLVFPITFPISFGTSDLLFTTGVIAYAGTWKSYPIITLTGPYTRAVITNDAFSAAIFMSVPILTGETRIIDLTPGAQSITDQDGNNKFSDLGVGSNLIDFAILPDPEAPSGDQTINIELVGGVNGVSGASLAYYERFFAL
jgi:hypothetical protein